MHLWLLSLDNVKVSVTVNEPAVNTLGLPVTALTETFIFRGCRRGRLNITVA